MKGERLNELSREEFNRLVEQDPINDVLKRGNSDKIFLQDLRDPDEYCWVISSKPLDYEEARFCFDVIIDDEWEEEWPE
jgi:hypothetical protein